MCQSTEKEKWKQREKLQRSNAISKIQKCEVPTGDILALIDLESTANAFSSFYRNSKTSTAEEKKEKLKKAAVSEIEKEFSKYEHRHAVEFAAESWNWNAEPSKKALRLKDRKVDVKTFPTSSGASGTRAYYRVIDQNEQNYILIACHVNVHGFHRGDLRFVEVNACTVVRGFEEHSVIGHFFPGDIVAVTKLRRTSSAPLNPPDVFKVYPSKKCAWEVEHMTVLTRRLKDDVVFGFLENGTAIAADHDEPMNVRVKSKKKRSTDKLYLGSTFSPQKLKSNTVGCGERNEWLVLQSSRIPSYPSPFGTIYEHRLSAEQTKWFDIGTDAFKISSDSKEQEQIVETCGIMGYTASNSVLNGRFDYRQFAMKDVKRNGLMVSFTIPNPHSEPTEGRWKCSNRVFVEGRRPSNNGEWLKMKAVVETVRIDPKRRLEISLRLSRSAPKDVNFSAGVFLVSQRENYGNTPLREKFFKNLKESSNGRRIITALYGGKAIKEDAELPMKTVSFPSTPPVRLNEYQEEYVNMLLARTPMVLGSSPFGCGKSMSIVTASLEIWKSNTQELSQKKRDASRKSQLLVTQSNFASVNLVDIVLRCEQSLKKEGVVPKFVRYVTLSNWRELPDNCRTVYDMPALAKDVFTQWARCQTRAGLNTPQASEVTLYVLEMNYLQPNELVGQAKRVYYQFVKGIIEKRKKLKDRGEPRLPTKEFFQLYRPDIVMTTADSLLGLLSSGALLSNHVSHIQIDEASQLPEYMLISLLSNFPGACFGMIGDVHQLPPYCEDDLTGKLKEYGIGNTMERALEANMFPRANLRTVYRCHPETTHLLSDLFYGGQLIAGVTADMRNEFMRKRPDLWPNANFSIAIVDNRGKSTPMGKSAGNRSEKQIVMQLVNELLREHNGYHLKPEEIGVISFYAAQTSELMVELRQLGVKCGTVDAFQGNEREVMVVCCTNEKITDFMQVSNRINVAMSRARQATFVIGNVAGLNEAQYWSTIVKEVKKRTCLVDTTKYPFSSSESTSNQAAPKKDDRNKKIQKKKKKMATKKNIENEIVKDVASKPVKTPTQIRRERHLRSKAAKKLVEAMNGLTI